jgi:hypothetical protein
VSSSGIPCGFTLDVLLYKNPYFEGFEGSEGSEVMLGWIVLLMRMNEILLWHITETFLATLLAEHI